MVRLKGGLCDSCNIQLSPTAGYLVSNGAVVVSESYWVHTFRSSVQADIAFLQDREQLQSYFVLRLKARAKDRTPWLICDDCTELFLVDWDQARACRLRGTRPPGSGRVKIADFVLPAARAWERVYGWWPDVVARSVADDECDLCRKPLWDDEPVAFMKADLISEWRRAGVLETDPVGSPRTPQSQPGVSGWLVCIPCQARLVARLHRLHWSPE